MIIGAVCGVLIANWMDKMEEAGESIGAILFNATLLFIGMYVAIFLQIIFHEAGHLLFGLMTGYRFSSFRIGSFMWVKDGASISFKRLTIAGTGGQCLLIPPDMKEGKYPFVLYNLGGSIINLISALLFAGLRFFGSNSNLISPMLMMLVVIGVAIGLMNGIPLKLGTINNDGYNTLSISKNKEARRSFWLQMKVNGDISLGNRLKDMPDEWFEIPSEESMKNSMTAVIGVLACNRLMDQMRFAEANQAMEKILKIDSGIVGLHRNMLVGDRIYCELVGENREDKLNELMDIHQKKFMKAMKNYPSVIRTEYAYALLAERDEAKAMQIGERFDKIAKKYPYPSEIVGERELMAYSCKE